MRKLLVLLAIAGFAAPAVAAEQKPTAEQQARTKQVYEVLLKCQYQPQLAVDRGVPVTPRRLTEAPPARMERAVNRTINGCPVPVIVPNGVEGK